MTGMAAVRGRGQFVLLASFLLAWLVSCPPAFALNPALDVSQYAHTAWRAREGFTQGRIDSIVQTPDGYLWLGTEIGLFRFDGVTNVPWQPPADQHLPSNFTPQLLAAHDGTLWIGTDKGVASWKDGRLTLYPQLAGQIVIALLEDRDGSVWVGTNTVSTGKLCAIRNGGVQCYAENGELGRGVRSLFEDSKGDLWVAAQNGLWRWKPGPPKLYPLSVEPDSIQVLCEDDRDALLLGLRDGIRRLVDEKTEAYPLPGMGEHFDAYKMLRDRDGGLWIGTPDRGVVHVHQGRTDVFSSSGGLSGDFVGAIFEDREGSIWVATNNGLDRFREFAIPTFSVSQGSSNASVYAVLPDRDGSVWLSTTNGLHRWDHGQFSIYGRGTPQSRQTGNVPLTLFQDHLGKIWVATLREFGYLEGGRFISFIGIPGGVVRSIAENTSGDLWIANQNLGLFRLSSRNEVLKIPWSELGHTDFASALATDPLRGGLWLGFYHGGVAYFKDGQVRASYTAADGLGEGLVNDFWLDPDGTLWAATAGGLSRLKDGRVATLTTRDGLPCNAVHWMIEDNAHSLWLYTSCGLIRVARTELDAWAGALDKDKDAKRTIKVTVFDGSDGVLSHSVYPIGFSPPVGRSTDGRLWFPGVGGVSVVDPSHLPFNKLPPPVHIEQVIADRKPYETSTAGARMRLPPRARDLEIDYTALSLVAAEKVLFRYKLEGWDRDWQDVGTRRQAFYTNLAPRNYRFRVMACNNSGVWNEAGEFLDFSIAPAYYQTTWFRVLLAAAFIALLATLYRLRVRQVARRVRGLMEERLDERERIARDLHDTLLQSVQGLMLKVHAAASQVPREMPAHGTLEKALDRADEVLAEGRDRVRNLRSAVESFSDLPAAFKRVARDNLQGDATFRTVVEGDVRELHPLVLEESYCIGREALINAMTHSKGSHVEVEITYDPRQFRLRVRDNGHGVDPKILEDGGRPGHWGLQGMRERSERVGGQLKIWSGHVTGTEIELTVPGATAYRQSGDKHRSTWFRRSSSIDGEQL
jgi:ligand-binding sensor domain-containing protein/signal transduction histidine kinase